MWNPLAPYSTTPAGHSLLAPCDSELKRESITFLVTIMNRLRVSLRIQLDFLRLGEFFKIYSLGVWYYDILLFRHLLPL